MNSFGKVAVLYGGNSAEREVSIMSGNAVFAAFKRKNIDAHLVDVAENLYQQLHEGQFDRAFVALHGPGGEDGKIQGFLETIGLPYTGSDVAASALAMDKEHSKWLWLGMGIPTLPFVLIDKTSNPKEINQTIPLPWAIKPVSQGSTFGVSKVTDIAQFQEALTIALEFDARVILEPWVEGKELTVGVLGDQALPVIYIEAPQGFYGYDAKYFSNETQYHCPSGLPTEIENRAKEIGLAAYRSLGCRHWARTDIMMDNQNQLWVLEVNTIPGLTDHSLVPKAAKQIDINFDDLVVKILAMTLEG